MNIQKDSKIHKIKQINEKETRELEQKIVNKLNMAEENRLDQINSVVERMKEHVSSHQMHRLAGLITFMTLLILHLTH